eukprot:scaffold357_cov400-Prasinococcus_capsulatus_cf.AAC.14
MCSMLYARSVHICAQRGQGMPLSAAWPSCRSCARISVWQAARGGWDWLLHIDIDELLLPKPGPPNASAVGATDPWLSCSIPRVLDEVPANKSVAHFHNHESVPESMGVQHRFTEVTLFKTALETRKKNITHAYPPPLVNLYANGKSAARLSAKPRVSSAHGSVRPAGCRCA